MSPCPSCESPPHPTCVVASPPSVVAPLKCEERRFRNSPCRGRSAQRRSMLKGSAATCAATGSVPIGRGKQKSREPDPSRPCARGPWFPPSRAHPTRSLPSDDARAPRAVQPARARETMFHVKQPCEKAMHLATAELPPPGQVGVRGPGALAATRIDPLMVRESTVHTGVRSLVRIATLRRAGRGSDELSGQASRGRSVPPAHPGASDEVSAGADS